jgi:hypothetical protein
MPVRLFTVQQSWEKKNFPFFQKNLNFHNFVKADIKSLIAELEITRNARLNYKHQKVSTPII